MADAKKLCFVGSAAKGFVAYSCGYSDAKSSAGFV
jgi:hypothetical protein